MTKLSLDIGTVLSLLTPENSITVMQAMEENHA